LFSKGDQLKSDYLTFSKIRDGPYSFCYFGGFSNRRKGFIMGSRPDIWGIRKKSLKIAISRGKTCDEPLGFWDIPFPDKPI